MTHTIEVSQISRTIAKALELNSDLAEVLALSHDIGHPPFSHEGEKALDRIMKEFGSGFDHNLHALRIVEDFEEKYAAFRGLNLTFEVREGIIKHSRDYPAGATASVDIGPYRLGQRPPLEAQLIDLADEIAYNSADLDDGYDSGLLTVLQMESELRLFRRLWREVTERFPGAGERVRISEVIRRVIDTLVTDLIVETRHRLNEGRIASVEDVRRAEHRLVGFSQETGALNLELKQFLRDRLYDHRVLKRAREDAQRQLEDLFRYYLSQPETLPLSHRERIHFVLESVSLLEAVDKMPSELSGGMRKRIGLARSIITKPKLMLYDEPTTGLDPITSKEISVLINDLQHALNMTSIVVTHDLLCAKIIADRAIVLDDGKIVKEGSITELVNAEEPLLKNFFSDKIFEHNGSLK